MLFFCQGMHSTYTVNATYRLFDFMKYHFGWKSTKEIAFYNAIYAQAHLPGQSLGAFITGRLLKYGRRPCLIAMSLIASLGILI
jgi:hypothetical protein